MSEFAHNLAIVIGINQYDGGIAPLQTAVNDATVLAQILKEKHNYQVRLWVNEQATLTNLNHLFEELLPKTVTEGDRLLFYFAGHGIALNGEGGPEGYLIPQDARLGKVESYLPMSELNQALAKLPCRHFLAVLDCCFAGAFRWSSNRDVSTLPEVIHKERYDRFIQDPAWQVITSAAHDQKALDILTLRDRTGSSNANNHSPFAAALMNALAGEADSSPPARDGKPAGDGVITATELYLYLRDEVERNTENLTKRQTPGLWCLENHDKGEYIFLTPGHEMNLPPAPPLDVSSNPYRGLASFEEEHSNLFFGRSTLTKRLQEFVVQHLLTVVLGASGSGKSSLVKAGLIPCLKQLHQTQETQEQWKILGPIRPGESPLTALQSALKGSILPLADVLAQGVGLDEKTLVSGMANWKQQHPDTKLLLLIDQFEELVTLCRDDVQRERFLKLLAHVLNSCSEQLHLLLTLRSDFEPQFRDTPLEGYWKDARFVVAAMTREELREAIEEPVSLRVMHFEPHNLVDQLIDEVAQMPGALPLLSFALSELYLKYLQRQEKARNRGETLDRAITETDYDELGGVTRSLTQRADQEYNALFLRDLAYAQTIRNVMLRMANIGSELSRRRVLLSELEFPEPENFRIQEVIQCFLKARLLTSGTNSESQPYVEPAHDVLIQGWGKLLQWIGEEQSNLPLQRDLSLIARYWVDRKHSANSAGLLWSNDPRLALVKKIFESNQDRLNSVEVEFIQRSLYKKRSNLIRLISSVVIFIIGISLAAVITFIQRNEAIYNEADALIGVANSQIMANNQLGALVTSVKVGRRLKKIPWVSNEIKFRSTALLQQAVYRIQEINRLEAEELSFNNVRISSDGDRIVASSINQIFIWNSTGQLLKSVNSILPYIRDIKFSPDSKIIVETSYTSLGSGFSGGSLYDQDGNFLRELPEETTAVSFSPDSKLLITGNESGHIYIWNADEGTLISSIQAHTKWITDLKISSSSEKQLIISASADKTIKMWMIDGTNLKTLQNIGNETKIIISVDEQLFASVEPKERGGISKTLVNLWSISGNFIKTIYEEDSVGKLVFSPNNQLIATASDDKTVKVWNRRGELIKTLQHEGGVTDVAFSPDSRIIASGSVDGILRLWNIDGSLRQTFRGHNSGIYEVAFTPNGQTIITTGSDRTIRIWRCDGALLDALPQEDIIKDIVFSPDSQIMALSNSKGGISIWDYTGNLISNFSGHNKTITRLSFSPDGEILATASEDSTVKLWSRHGKLLHVLRGHNGSVNDVNFSPDGKIIASSGDDGVVNLWNRNGKLTSSLRFLDQDSYLRNPLYRPVRRTFFSQDNQKIFTVDDDVRIWSRNGNLLKSINTFGTYFSPDSQLFVSIFEADVAAEYGFFTIYNSEGVEIATVKGHNSHISELTFSPDSSYFATSGDGLIKLWNRNGKEIGVLRGSDDLDTNISISPDGKIIVSSGESLYLWNQEGRLLQELQGHTGSLEKSVFSPDGKVLASFTNSIKPEVILWNLDLDSLMKRGCSWLHAYLKSSPSIMEEERYICDNAL